MTECDRVDYIFIQVFLSVSRKRFSVFFWCAPSEVSTWMMGCSCIGAKNSWPKFPTTMAYTLQDGGDGGDGHGAGQMSANMRDCVQNITENVGIRESIICLCSCVRVCVFAFVLVLGQKCNGIRVTHLCESADDCLCHQQCSSSSTDKSSFNLIENGRSLYFNIAFLNDANSH